LVTEQVPMNTNFLSQSLESLQSLLGASESLRRVTTITIVQFLFLSPHIPAHLHVLRDDLGVAVRYDKMSKCVCARACVQRMCPLKF